LKITSKIETSSKKITRNLPDGALVYFSKFGCGKLTLTYCSLQEVSIKVVLR